MRWQLWKINGFQVEFNRYLHPNEHTERIFQHLVGQLESEPSKIGHLQISKSISGAKFNLIFLKQKILFEYQIRRTTFKLSFKASIFLTNLKKLYLIKMSPIWRLVIKLFYKIQTNPFRTFICDHKTIEFHLIHHENPRPWSC